MTLNRVSREANAIAKTIAETVNIAAKRPNANL
jgi:hypothetical protein